MKGRSGTEKERRTRDVNKREKREKREKGVVLVTSQKRSIVPTEKLCTFMKGSLWRIDHG